MRALTSDDRVLIRAMRVEKGWGALRMMKEFPSRQQKRSTLNDLIKRLTKLAVLTETGVTVDLGLFVRQTTLPSLMNSFADKKVNQAQVSRHKKFHVKQEYHDDQFSAL